MKHKLKYFVISAALLVLGVAFFNPRLNSATITKGYTFATNEQVTATKLHALVDSATISGIASGDFADGSVANAKLSANAVTTDKILDGTILGGDIASRTLTNLLYGTNSVDETALSTNINFRAGFLVFTNATVTYSSNQIASAAVVGVTNSAGAGDAGKVVRLDGIGKIGTSMYSASPFTSATSFTSTNMALSVASAVVNAHGLGGMPSLVQGRLVCLSGDQGYTAGDELIISLGATDAGANVGVSVVADATSLNIRFGAGTGGATFVVPNKTTGSAGGIANANWAFVVRAWK